MSLSGTFTRSVSAVALPCPEDGRWGISRKNMVDYPDWAGSYFEMGLIVFNDYSKKGETSYLREALHYFDQAIVKGDDRFPEFYVARSATHFLLDDNESAENDLKKAQFIDKNDYAVLNASAFFYQEIGRMEEAEKLRQKIVELFPNKVEAHVNYAYFCLPRDEQKALKHYTIATELAPESVDRWFEKGLLLRILGKFDEAEEALNRAIELNQDEDRRQEIYEQLELAKQRQS